MLLRVDGGLVDEHVVVVLVDDHEVVGDQQERVANRQESLEVVKVSSDEQDDSNQLVQEIPLSRR